jgi:hypothetical protein
MRIRRMVIAAGALAALGLGLGGLGLGGLGLGELRAQTAEPAQSAAAKIPVVFRDLEKEPPTTLGTKLDPNADWSDEARVAILRPRLDPLPFSEPFLSRKGCDFRVKDDWLKMRCPGRAGRVHQLAGEPKDTVAHISHQRFPNPKGGFIDNSRLLFFTRMVPGKASVFEITHIGEGYDSDFEIISGMLSVDWTDPDSGPRISLSPSPGWW